MLNKLKSNQSGNAAVIALVVLVIAAVVALAYLSGNLVSEKKATDTTATADAAAETPAATETAAGDPNAPATPATEAPKPLEITPGNPVVAKVDGQDVLRQDVFAFIQNLPPQTRQMPMDQLYPLALEQVINGKVVEKNTANINLDNDEEVKKQLELAKKQIEQTVYLQNMVNEKITDDKIKAMYDKLVAETPKEQEVKAAHILVDDEAKAKEIIQKLIETGDFATLAKENSKDATAEKGGDLGYFLKGDVVKEFGDAAFAMEPGTYTKDPVKTQFGYHIIKVDDKRERQPPTLEQAKPFIEANLRREALEEIVKGWRDASNIERFNINGTGPIPAPSLAPTPAPASTPPAAP